MIRRILLIASVLLVGLAPGAAAQYGEVGLLTVDNPTPGPGDPITVVAEHCEDGVVSFYLIDADGTRTPLGTAQVSSPAVLETEIPAGTPPGRADIEATCENGDTDVLSIEVVAEAAQAAALPRTGSSLTGPLVRSGVVLVSLGGLVLLAVRKRSAGAAA